MTAMPVDWRMRMVAWLSDRIGSPTEVAGHVRGRESIRRTSPAMLFGRPAAMFAISDERIAEVPVRRFVPTGAHDGVILWFHGGGWVVGDVDSHHIPCRALAEATKRQVISVDYRLAPEHRFPAALDDCLAVTRALAGVHQAVAVAGDSAGGNLAAVVARRFRDEGRKLRAQLLVYPVTDCGAESPSYERYASGFLLARSTMRYYTREYVPDDATRLSPDVSPLRAASLEGVAPARVVLAECDVLHDEGAAYAEKLRAAGVPTELDEVPGFLHGFFNLQGFPESRAALARAAQWLQPRLD